MAKMQELKGIIKQEIESCIDEWRGNAEEYAIHHQAELTLSVPSVLQSHICEHVDHLNDVLRHHCEHFVMTAAERIEHLRLQDKLHEVAEQCRYIWSGIVMNARPDISRRSHAIAMLALSYEHEHGNRLMPESSVMRRLHALESEMIANKMDGVAGDWHLVTRPHRQSEMSISPSYLMALRSLISKGRVGHQNPQPFHYEYITDELLYRVSVDELSMIKSQQWIRLLMESFDSVVDAPDLSALTDQHLKSLESAAE